MSISVKDIIEARRFRVTVGDVSFSGLVPTWEKYWILLRDNATDAEFARNSVDGWEGVKGSDLVKGGSDEAVPFDKELFDVVIGERPVWWRAIVDELLKRLKELEEEKESTEKNSRSGSKAKASAQTGD